MKRSSHSPNDEFGEEVKTIVEPVTSATPGDELARELVDFCQSRPATHKCPRTVGFIGNLPRMPSGKVRKVMI